MKDKGVIFNIQKFSIHDGPGIRTTVFMKGCPLRCPWCANPESQLLRIQRCADGTEYGEVRSVEDILRVVRQDAPFYEESGGGVTLSGGEPLFQFEFARSLLRALRAEGYHTEVETTGCIPEEKFMDAARDICAFCFDVKHYDAERHRAVTGVSNELILRNLRSLLADGRDVLVRIPVIPGFNDSADDARGFCALFETLGVRRVELLPFHQFGEKKYAILNRPYEYQGVPALREEDMKDYRHIFLDAGIELVTT